MTQSVALAYAATSAAALTVLILLLRSSFWPAARSLCVLLAFSFVWDAATLAFPDVLWTARGGVFREAVTAGILVAYAVEIALAFPRHARTFTFATMLCVAVFVAIVLVVGWPERPRAMYRTAALLEIGAAGTMIAVAFSGLMFDIRLGRVAKRAVPALTICFLGQGISIAPFEAWFGIAHHAQLAASLAWVVTLIAIGSLTQQMART